MVRCVHAEPFEEITGGGVGGMPQNQHKSLEWSESSGKGNTESERPCLTCGPWQRPSLDRMGRGEPVLELDEALQM